MWCWSWFDVVIIAWSLKNDMLSWELDGNVIANCVLYRIEWKIRLFTSVYSKRVTCNLQMEIVRNIREFHNSN